MKIVVFKGFSKEEIDKYQISPLINTSLDDKFNIINYNLETIKNNIIREVSIHSQEDVTKYLAYEEFLCACRNDNGLLFLGLLSSLNVEVKIVYNNIYPELYPCYFTNQEILERFLEYTDSDNKEPDPEIKNVIKFYNKVYLINDKFYISYNNIEYDMPTIEKEKKYSIEIPKKDEEKVSDFIYEINEDEQEYIEKIEEIKNNNYRYIGVKIMGNTPRIKEIFECFCAFINTNKDYILTSYEKYGIKENLIKSFQQIVTDTLKVPDFKSFRDLEFYENPNLNNKLIKINQTQIMTDMVEQALAAQKCEKEIIESNGKRITGYRDIFVTAPTGAGKSLMFQIPAIYLAEKSSLLTIIVTPLIELMNDQVRNLHERGYFAAERLNSSINPIEKKNIVKKVSEQKINLLYLAPETLLSYSIEQLIGDRKIGLIIIDEAHIVSTWGKGFRPDYWYLGAYLDKLRKIRNSKGLKDEKKKIYCFPICTFTATAVNGGKYDDVSDIKISLNLRDTITYYGKVIRDNIKFDIEDYSMFPTKNRDDYEEQKNRTLKYRLEQFIKNNQKAIVYFPFASTANAAYNANEQKGFKLLNDLKDNFSIYIGGESLTSNDKLRNMLNFRDNKKSIMFATKAFGMGIDIKDISCVYHYAASGNLNDYVQEIGRVARSKSIEYGIASADYYDRDLNYMKTLYGMSALHNYQVQKILSIIINIYDAKKKYNLMVTPDMFKPVFPNCSEDQLENKIKSALLTIEKDLTSRYRGCRPIVTRARNLFTECYVDIDKDQENNILNSKYGKYLKKISKGREKESYYKDQNLKVSDFGDVFVVNLKELWEEENNSITFGEFKYHLNNNEMVFGEFQSYIHLRNKITIKMLNGENLSALKEISLEEVDIISKVLNNFQISGQYFSKDDFANKLNEFYQDEFKSNIIANSYIEMLAEYKDEYSQNFYDQRTIKGEIKYLITKGSFRGIAEKIINTSHILKKLKYIQSEEYTAYDAAKIKSFKRDSRYDAINLALLFGLVSFEISGGNKPEIFIRINNPDKIRQFVKGTVRYNNAIIYQARERHKNDVAILKYFFTCLKTDTDRWNFIENYYLGRITTDSEGNIQILNEVDKYV